MIAINVKILTNIWIFKINVVYLWLSFASTILKLREIARLYGVVRSKPLQKYIRALLFISQIMQNIYTEEFKQAGVYEIKNKINNKRIFVGEF